MKGALYMKTRSQSVAFCGLAIALIAVSAWVTIPLGPVPFTLQILMLTLVLLVLPPREMVAAIVGYVALGAIGLPVFSGMRGGIGVVMGTTGGYIIGYAVGACLVALLFYFWKEPANKKARFAREIAASALFLVVVYILGWIQLAVVADLSAGAAFVAGVAPFVIPDAIKIGVATVVAHAIKQSLPALGAAKKVA
jgi:biotin transport system substrate-specific component